jgi:hypothetical protein
MKKKILYARISVYNSFLKLLKITRVNISYLDGSTFQFSVELIQNASPGS